MNCPNCQLPHASSNRFCEHCGQGLLLNCQACDFTNQPDARFCGGCGAQLAQLGATPISVQTSEPIPSEAERRHLTILFCDIVGSTEMSTHMDPEDLRDVILYFERGAAKVIAAHGGFIARYMGDGVLVYFGYPQAREDDAERAIRCGLALIDEVGSEKVDLRVGIASGPVVVGDLIGTGAAKEQAVVGQAPNLAARLQALAEPHCVVVGPATRNLVGDLFEQRLLGERQIKGFDEPLEIWQVLGERRGASRFEARHSSWGPMFGRDAELQFLTDHWLQVTQGKGCILCVQGEAGMGKSRLAQGLMERVVEANGVLDRYSCSPYFQNTPLYPISSGIEYEAGFARGDSNDQRMQKLETLLGTVAGSTSVRYIAAVISLLFGSGFNTTANTPQEQKEKTLEALEQHLVFKAQTQPLLVLFEDLHWADPTTLEFLARLAEAIQDLPVMILATARPEFTPPWQELEQAESLQLHKISEKACRQIVAANSGQQLLPDSIAVKILLQSDCNPLYLEELTHAILETNKELGSGDYLPPPEDLLAVPLTLQDSLMARLDRFEDSSIKETAQLAAVLGREFSAELLEAASPLSTTALNQVLAQLTDATLLLGTRTNNETVYSFKHALLRDAAYESLLQRRRRTLHKKIALMLDSRQSQGVQHRPELIARHFTSAEDYSRAIKYWRQAGVGALSQASYVEAIDHLKRALSLVPRLDQTENPAGLEFEIQGELGIAIASSQGYANEEVEHAFRRELVLSEQLSDVERYSASRRIGTFYIVRAEFDHAREVLNDCVRISESSNRVGDIIDAYNGLGYVESMSGSLVLGRSLLDKALVLYRQQGGREITYVTEQDPGLAALSLACVVAWVMGDASGATSYKAELIQTADRVNRPFDTAYAHSWVATLDNIAGNHESALLHADTAVAVAEKYGIVLWQLFASVIKFRSEQALGVNLDASAAIGQCLEGYNMTGAVLSQPYMKLLLAQSQMYSGEVELALATISGAIAQSNRTGDKMHLPRLQQFKGDALLQLERPADALTQWQTALILAQDQQSGFSAISLLTRLAGNDQSPTKITWRTKLSVAVDETPVQHRSTIDLQAAQRLLREQR